MAGDRATSTAAESTNAINAVFAGVYQACMGVIGSSWPFDGWGCGGTSEETACQRVAWQVVNTAYYPAEPLQTEAHWDGRSNYNVLGPPPNPNGPWPPPNYQATSGTMLGASKTIWETQSSSYLCAGACNDGGCNTTPSGTWSCAGGAYQPSAFTANIPQNILNAAKRLGNTPVTVTVGSGITAGYDTYSYVYHTGAGCICATGLYAGGTSTCEGNGECYCPPAGKTSCHSKECD